MNIYVVFLAFYEFYEFLAFLAIGLISVTIPTYAISISYLGRETESTLNEIKRRKDRFTQKLEELRNRLAHEGSPETITAIKKEINEYERGEHQLRNRLFFLSANGAVFLPLIFYILSLGTAIYALTYPPSNLESSPLDIRQPQWPLISLGIGLLVLWQTLHGVETAALRPEEKLLPAFTVTFDDGATTRSYEGGKEQAVEIDIRNNADVVARNVSVFMAFPPEFTIPEPTDPNAALGKQAAETIQGISIKDYSGAWMSYTIIHSTVTQQILIPLNTPPIKQQYKIPVIVYSEEAKPSEHVLTMQII